MTYPSIQFLKTEVTYGGMGMTSIDFVFCAGQASDCVEVEFLPVVNS